MPGTIDCYFCRREHPAVLTEFRKGKICWGCKSKLDRCWICGRDDADLEEHHRSYKPEKRMQVCIKCHNRIHAGGYPEYQPDMSRGDAIAKGLLW